ncbi:MAG TPA: DNA-directed RNA polymerase subunit alpha C-terminal domain-containing protein [Ktedonobacterales bacterium]|nr:DNA-directed RNA polymerase subunit alpha C-terminal domain-containing protein [Ktedonobacterales bacterium]
MSNDDHDNANGGENVNDDSKGRAGRNDDEPGHSGDHEAAEGVDRPGTYTVTGPFAFVRLVGKASRTAGMPLSSQSPIEALELEPRTYNCLTRAGLHRVSDVASLTDGQLLAIRNFSRMCLADLRERLKDLRE